MRLDLELQRLDVMLSEGRQDDALHKLTSVTEKAVSEERDKERKSLIEAVHHLKQSIDNGGYDKPHEMIDIVVVSDLLSYLDTIWKGEQ